ncbi:MAG: proline--tRNA ligase [Anaerolineae bacterium]|nr:proline--tRNA ligase [Anaerolineae bacterium]
MRFSSLFGHTRYEEPAEAQERGLSLALRAGLLAPTAQGSTAYLPLGQRALEKIQRLVEAKLQSLGGQKLLLPILQPQASPRAHTGSLPLAGPGESLALASSYTQALHTLVAHIVRSYRQLPLLLYALQPLFFSHPRGKGSWRIEEEWAAELYCLQPSPEALEGQLGELKEALQETLAACGLQGSWLPAPAGELFAIPYPKGPTEVIRCPHCGYAAKRDAARFFKGEPRQEAEAPLERVPTPGASTIEAVAKMLGVEKRQTLKAVFYSLPHGEVLFVLIRGDLEVDEAKLSHLLAGEALHPASAEELQAAGLVAGYASPINVQGVRVIADDSILTGNNFVAGANEPGYHFKNVNYPRDFTTDLIADIALVNAGYPCPQCGAPLQLERALPLALAEALAPAKAPATFLDQEGKAQPLMMGHCSLYLGRVLLGAVAQHHDEAGIIWPISIAPYQVHLLALGKPGSPAQEKAEALYERIQGEGFEVLYDDRKESPGVKFNDADLLGIPLRLTVSRRTLAAKSVELKPRWSEQSRLIPEEEIIPALHKALAEEGQAG